jgi:separase
MTPFLDTIFTLARIALDPSKPESHQLSYELLCRTLMLPGLALRQFLQTESSASDTDEPRELDITTKLNYQRCISGAFFNSGAVLYRAGKHSVAARFIRVGSSVGSYALEEHRRQPIVEGTDTEKRKFWIQLEEQVYQRWDLLGSCYMKTGERQVS